ncbi:ExeM/NucH family extracellular endonuclease [Jannaschia formosa]|uniref:ExeM/NucH family extracellular endonuclease n=1 Tax=Jannaschia formosa TaxID=2259592 RepID=UPI000E1BE752|nr:ExeM/NucH family extracellular endonuclease [Jannaschia formosa]TFL15992.1 ExeM/NucH family extracellular endonuclease [Jannaschia formosa]
MGRKKQQASLSKVVFGDVFGNALQGADGRDVIFGRSGDDEIAAGADRDHVFGGFGNDDIDGGAGDDKLFGGFGDDSIRGGEGDDRIQGGPGDDTAVYDGAVEDYEIATFGRFNQVVRVTATGQDVSDAGSDFLKGIEALYFAADDYTLFLDGTNNAPLAGDDTATTDEDSALILDATTLLANDREFDGDTLTVVAVDARSAAGATVTLSGGEVTYDPGNLFDDLAVGETATDTFTYTVGDGMGGTDTATVTVTVEGRNDAPRLFALSELCVAEDTAGFAPVLAASDIDGDALGFAVTGGADAALFDVDAMTGALSFASAPVGGQTYEVELSVEDGNGGTDSQLISVEVAQSGAAITPRINEIHYDNGGADTGEFIEVRVAAGADVSGLSVELLNGSNGLVYQTAALPAAPTGTDGTYDYYVLPIAGIQNGSPDGVALIQNGSVLEFLSYEGSFTAAGGTAAGLTSTDIGASEGSSTLAGQSLQRGEGDDWTGPADETPGAENAGGSGGGGGGTPPPAPGYARINEVHYDNDGADAGEFIEVRVDTGTNVSAMFVELLNGSNGTIYGTASLSGQLSGSDALFDYYVLDIADFGVSGIQNGAPDGVALVDGGTVLEFLSYEGSFTAAEGTVAGLTSTDIGVAEGGGTAIGSSLQRNNDGTWDAGAPETPGAANDPLPATVTLNELAVSTTGTDWEFAELFGVAGTSLDGYALLQLDGDGEIRSILDFSGLALGSNGFALTASDQAQATFGVEPDLTFANDTFTNTASTFLLVDGFTGAARFDDLDTDDDGVLDVTPFASVVDSVALVDGGTPLLYSGNVVGPDGSFLPAGAARTEDGGGTFTATDFSASGTYSPTPAATDAATTYAIAALDEDAFEGDSGTTGFAFEITRAGDLSEPGSVDIAIGGGVDGDDLTVPTLAATVTFAPGQSCATVTLDVTGDQMPEGDEALEVTLANAVGGEIVEGAASVTILDDDTITLISEVQGAGADSPLLDQTVTVEAVVTKVVSNGFFLQEEDSDADGDAATSEGVFVFTGGMPSVAVGDLVKAAGIVDEFFGETQIALSGLRVISSGNPVPTAAAVLLSGAAVNFEAVEGMRIALDSGIAGERITVTENFNLDRFGEIAVSAGNKYQPTQLFDAQTEAAEIAALTEANANNRLLIDDGVSGQNPVAFEFIPNTTPGDNGNGYLDAGDTFIEDGPTLRLGAEIEGTTTGVMRFAFGQYRMLVDEPLNIDPATNERPDGFDDVGGTIQVAAFNVLNYFTTLSGNTVGPNNLSPRGASSEFDLERQTDKIVAAVLGTGAEVLALQEIENDGFGAGKAPDTLVAAINAEIGSDDFAYVDPTGIGGFIGTDAITTGMIFDQTQVRLINSDFLVFDEASAADTFALADVLNDVVPSFDQLGDFERNRPAVAATFEDLTTGETFTVVSVHFKSKGDSGLDDLVDAAQDYLDGGGTQITQADIDAVIDDANFDQGDGQGFWNQVRADAAAELFTWLETTYMGGVEDYLVMGDLNAYAKEDPVQTLTDAGLEDLVDAFIGQDEAYSFVFNGQRGSLDQALASDGIADAVTGVAEWHINADEPDLLNYNSRFNDPAFFEPSPYAASDHDPVILGLDLGTTDMLT